MSMEQTLHRAVQYIAAAGISHVPKEADDSHTTLLWEFAYRAMVGRPIPATNGCHFALCLPEYAIMFRDAESDLLDTLPLQGAEHEEVVSWFRRMLKSRGADPAAYRFEFHYELPEHAQREPFPSPDVDELDRLAELRSTAHRALELVLAAHGDTEPVRIWPHHFDSGAMIVSERNAQDEMTATIGMGLAIPDPMISTHYLYVSPWNKADGVDLTALTALPEGRWCTVDWKGAVLEADGLDVARAQTFLHAATDALLERVST